MKTSIERILVPLDGSPHGDAAVQSIGALLRMHQPEVLLLGVMGEVEYDYSLRSHLDSVCEDLRSNGVDAAVAIREGKPAAKILEYAHERAVDLIAMSTHGRGGLSRAFMGSVTEEVLRRSDLPLLVCRPNVTGRDWKRILVALDGSERAEEILPDVARLARAGKASVDLVRVALPVVVSGGLGEAPMYFASDNPMPYLQQVSGRMLAEGVEAHPIALEGRAASEVVRYAKETIAGLLCLTTHGRSGLSRMLLGSIAEEILRHAPCPVLIRRMAEAPKLAEKV